MKHEDWAQASNQECQGKSVSATRAIHGATDDLPVVRSMLESKQGIGSRTETKSRMAL